MCFLKVSIVSCGINLIGELQSPYTYGDVLAYTHIHTQYVSYIGSYSIFQCFVSDFLSQ